jgi:hypothetical protein
MDYHNPPFMRGQEEPISRQSTQMSEKYKEEEEEVKQAPGIVIVEDKYQKMMRELQETRKRAAETLERGA